MDRTDRDKKTAWKAGVRAAARAAFPLPDDQLESLFEHVEDRVELVGCDDTRAHTLDWLGAHAPAQQGQVLAWLDEQGGHCDCEVVANARDHWEQYRQPPADA